MVKEKVVVVKRFLCHSLSEVIQKNIPDIKIEEWSKKWMEDKGKGKVVSRCEGKATSKDGRGDWHTKATKKIWLCFWDKWFVS